MKVAVVGAGVAGLASAARLAAAGDSVTVFDPNRSVGGKMTEVHASGFRFDAGPSLFTLPENLDDVFLAARRDPRNFYNYRRLDVCCDYFFADGARVRAYAEPAAFAREVEAQLGEPRERVEAYLARARKIYGETAPLFLERSLHRWATYTSGSAWKALRGLPSFALLSTMHQVNRKWFTDPRLVQLFDRYATYNGSDPYQAPGVLTQIPHLEHNVGAFFPNGGMVQIPQALHKLGLELGVEYVLGTRVDRILHENGRVTGVQTDHGITPADVVVAAGDIVPMYLKLLPDLEPPTESLSAQRSSSAVIFYWGLERTFSDLGVHNIFFSADYEQEFRDIFGDRSAPTDPTVYVHVSSKVEPADAPEGCENWFVMVNVASNQGQDWPTLIAELRSRVLGRLSSTLKVDLSALVCTEEILEPRLIESRTSSFQGALYGGSSNHRQAAFLRHPNFSRQLEGLYFCGGSVHPGGGIPLCLNSARIVSDEVCRIRAGQGAGQPFADL